MRVRVYHLHFYQQIKKFSFSKTYRPLMMFELFGYHMLFSFPVKILGLKHSRYNYSMRTKDKTFWAKSSNNWSAHMVDPWHIWMNQLSLYYDYSTDKISNWNDLRNVCLKKCILSNAFLYNKLSSWRTLFWMRCFWVPDKKLIFAENVDLDLLWKLLTNDITI